MTLHPDTHRRRHTYIYCVRPIPRNKFADPSPRAQDERHTYEKCQYEEFKERVKKMDELRAAKGGERSN
jgi:hypothetical protein